MGVVTSAHGMAPTLGASWAARAPRRARVVIADDHAVLRDGVRTVLARAEAPGFEVVGEASDVSDTIAQVERHLPDLLILDISMPSGSGLSAVEACRRVQPSLAVVILTMHKQGAFVRAALQAGVRAYILKDAEPRDLIDALRAALRGGPVSLSPGLASELAAPAEPSQSLSAREREVVAMIARGFTYQEIGQRLYCSERTVKTYRARVVEKLGISSRAELTAFAHRNGLVTPEQIAGAP